MKYFTWDLYKQLQSNSESILEAAEDAWDDNLDIYNNYLNENQELFKIYNQINMHDNSLTNIQIDKDKIIMFFHDSKLCCFNYNNFRVHNYKKKLYNYKLMGDWCIHELFKNDNHFLLLNILFDSGIEINIEFKEIIKKVNIGTT